MNWTGGSLQRSKKANSGLLQRQRAYFAKVRWSLQTIAQTPTAPFCPSYLRDNSKSEPLAVRLFESISDRRGGCSVTGRGEQVQREDIPMPDEKWCAISRHQLPPHELPSRCVAHRDVQSETSPQAQEDLYDAKRKASNKNVGMQLLEANKKRLLAQADWMGIGASKPVQLQFVSCKQKEKIGKRRERTEEKCRAQKRPCVEGEVRPKRPYPEHRSFANLLGSRANRDGPENMEIRIGTEALADGQSAQLEDCAQSEAGSSRMLFEQDDLVSRASATCSDARRHGGTPSCAESVASRDELTSTNVDECNRSTRSFGPVDRGHNDERNLRFVFRGRAVPMGLRTRHVTGRQKVDETRLLEERACVSTCQAKYVHQVTDDSEDPSVYAIVDPKAWMAYLAISDVSSQANDMGICTKDELQPDESITEYESGHDSKWSEGATQGQEDEDGEGLGAASRCESLASLRWGIGRAVTGYVPEMKGIHADEPNWSHVQTLEEDEREWQAFVLGSEQSRSLPRVQPDARRRFA